MYAQLLSFELHNIDNIVDWLDQIELFKEFSELTSTQLSVIKHVINEETKDLGRTHLHASQIFLLIQIPKKISFASLIFSGI